MNRIWKIAIVIILIVYGFNRLQSLSIPNAMFLNPYLGKFKVYSTEGFNQLEGVIHQDYNKDGLLDMFLFGVNKDAAIAYANYDNPFEFNISEFECGFDYDDANFINVNNDNIIDIVSFADYPYSEENIYIYVFDSEKQSYAGTQCLGKAKGKISVGDYDHDGDDDILLYEPRIWDDLATDRSKKIDTYIYKNNNGMFELYCKLSLGLNYGEKKWDYLVWKDLDSDVDLDILAWAEDDTVYFSNTEGKYFRDDNTNTFAQTIYDYVITDNSLLVNSFHYMEGDVTLIYDDFDLDGDLDFVNINDDKSYLCLNNRLSPGTFIDLVGIYRTAYACDFVRVEDFDYDGYPDILLDKHWGTLNVPKYYEDDRIYMLKNLIPWIYALQSYQFAQEYFNSVASMIGTKFDCKYVFNQLQEFEPALKISASFTKMIAERDSLASYVKRPREEFESNADYKYRTDTMKTKVQEIINQYEPKIKMEKAVIDSVSSFIGSLKMSIANKSKSIVQIPFEIIGDYDPEQEKFFIYNELTIPAALELSIPISEAKAFKDDYKKLSISALRQINIDGEYIYHNLSITGLDSTLYEVSGIASDWWNTNISDQYENSNVALEALTAIFNVYNNYKQTRGSCTLDLAKKDAGLSYDAITKWSYSIIGSPPQRFVATSTNQHTHGEGKIVWFDAKQKKFHGFLVDDLTKP